MSSARWSGRLKRIGALASDVFAAALGASDRRNPARMGLVCLIDLVQDAELILPVARAARDSGAYEVRIVMTDWLDRVAPAIAGQIAEAGFAPTRHARDALLAGLAPDLARWDALLTASESSAAPHRFAHALTRRAKAAGLATFALQHGLENVGLTYRGDGAHDFASDWIFTWGDPARLPEWTPAALRERCIGVGRTAQPSAASDCPSLAREARPIVGVFENLHWQRYDEGYRRRFLADLGASAAARPDFAFVLRPHPAGLFSAKNRALFPETPNVRLADPSEAEWAALRAADLIRHAAAVITTPSSIALDAAIAGKPVAVTTYGLDLEAYAPLPLLDGRADWLRFIDGARESDRADLLAFRSQYALEGDACAAILETIAARIESRAGLERLPLRTRAAAKLVRTLRALPPPLGRLAGPARKDGARAYRRWLAETEPNQAEREAIRAHAGAWGAELLVSVIIDARSANDADCAHTLSSLNKQLMTQYESIVCGHDGAASLGEALAAAKGRYVAIVEAGDRLADHALPVLVAMLRDAPDALFAYSDEDATDDRGNRSDPHFKPDWDFDLFVAQDYVCRLAVFDAEAARQVGAVDAPNALYDLLGHMIRAAPERPILHSPFVLHHRRKFGPISAETVRPHELAGSPAASVELAGGVRRVRWALPEPAPLVSLIVPTRDRLPLLRRCVDGLLKHTAYPAFELIIVDNGSVDPETLAYLDIVRGEAGARVIRDDGAFNFARLNNVAAREAKGALLGLINNDIAVIEPDWLREMASLASRTGVGAVGAMLLRPNGTIQHAGCALGIGGVAAHLYDRMPADTPGHGGRLRYVHEVSAVTAACMLTRRTLWDELGGLDESFPVAYNDIDYCLRLRRAQHRVLWTPFARLEHQESASRGQDSLGARRARLERDKAAMRARWGAVLRDDPFYSPNLTLSDTDAGLAHPPRTRAFWRSE